MILTYLIPSIFNSNLTKFYDYSLKDKLLYNISQEIIININLSKKSILI